TFIEPSESLASRARMNNTNANVIIDSFESHGSNNKYDSIVMNPPFGQGGSIAIKHLVKAFEHLRDGGRVVALLPVGKMDELIVKYSQMGYFKDIYTVAEFALPSSTFKNAGTGVNTKIHVFERHDFKADAPQGVISKNLSHYDDIEDLFDAIENINIKPRKPRVDEALAEYGLEIYPDRSKYIITGEGIKRKDITSTLFGSFIEKNKDGDVVEKYNRSVIFVKWLKNSQIPNIAQFNNGLSFNNLPIKYQHPIRKYETWDGAGSMPDWLLGAINYNGKKLEDFAVERAVYDAVSSIDPQAILTAMRQALATPSDENIQALAMVAGLKIVKPIEPIKNSAGEVSTSNGLELKIAIQDKWKSAGIKSLSNIKFMVDPVVGEALTADTNIGRPIKIQLSDKPELKALWENYSAIKSDNDAQAQKAIQAKKDAALALDQVEIDKMNQQAKELMTKIPEGGIPVDFISNTEYSVHGISLSWHDVVVVGNASAKRKGALGSFKDVTVAYITPEKLAEVKARKDKIRDQLIADKKDLLTTVVPKSAMDLYKKYRGSAENAWSAGDDGAWAAINAWSPYIEAQASQDFNLSTYSEAELRAQEAVLKAAEVKRQADEKAAKDKAIADKQIGDFRLSGSSLPSDVAASYGQNDMFVQTRGRQVEKPKNYDDFDVGTKDFLAAENFHKIAESFSDNDDRIGGIRFKVKYNKRHKDHNLKNISPIGYKVAKAMLKSAQSLIGLSSVDIKVYIEAPLFMEGAVGSADG
ncbi:MAG TPA: methyltransferase, partial [Acinetobacter sp.]|nr:methyltransferase [Acinetobacter sp.]